jgi:chemosensory pili system protein ChpA (sensor histidine kinase/response regulator)
VIEPAVPYPPFDASALPTRTARDLAPLTWVVPELRRTLDEVLQTLQAFVADNLRAAATDLSAVDSSAMRLARQQLHQAVGALEMVDLHAAAVVLRAADAALQRLIQRPALAQPEAAAVLQRTAHVLFDYLDRLIRNRPVPDLALFPAYEQVQALAAAERVHPADLWFTAQADLLGSSSPEPPPGKAYQPGPQVRGYLDRFVLPVVKSLQPQAAVPLGQLAAGLARGAARPADARFWLVAAAYFEAVAASALPDNLYVKRAASRILLQYTHLTQGSAQGLETLARDLLFLLAHARSAPPAGAACWRAVQQGYGLPSGMPVDYQRELLGLYEPAALLQTRERLQAAQRALGQWQGAAEAAPLARALAELATSLRALHAPSEALSVALARYSDALGSLLEGAPVSVSAWLMELSRALLVMDATLAEFDPLDPRMTERHLVVARRLQQVLAGEVPAEPDAWMARLYQQLSERQTVVRVAAELQTELQSLEQVLDGFFRQPAGGALHGVAERLEKMRGVFALLGLPPAESALVQMAGLVRQLQDTETVALPDLARSAAGLFAPNFSALLYWVETLTRQPEGAEHLFAFDSAVGVLTPAEGPGAEPVDAVDAVDDAVDAVAVHDPAPDAMPAVTSSIAPTTPTATTPPSAVLPDQPSAEDAEQAELLGIFLDEAAEVFVAATQAMEALRTAGGALPALTTLRRAFHTLKGSSRMVGLTDFGESAWAMEQVLNAWLADQKPASQELLTLSSEVLQALSAWADTLRAGGTAAATFPGPSWAAAIRQSADALRLEQRVVPLMLPEAATEPEPKPTPEPKPEAVPAAAAEAPPEPVAEEPVRDDDIKVIGPLRIDLELYNVFLNEADEWSRLLSSEVSEWVLQPHLPMSAGMETLAHSLAGGSATVGYLGLSELARALEHALARLQSQSRAGRTPEAEALAVVQAAAEEIRHLLHQFAAGFLRAPSPATLEGLQAVGREPAPAARPEAGTPGSVAPLVEEAPAGVQAVPEHPATPAPDALDADLFGIFEDEALDLLPRLGSALRQWVARPDNVGARTEALRNLHTLKGSARLAGAMQLGSMAHALESEVLALPEQPYAEMARPLLRHLDELSDHFDTLRRAYAQATAAVNRLPGALPAQRGADTPEVALAAPEGLALAETTPESGAEGAVPAVAAGAAGAAAGAAEGATEGATEAVTSEGAAATTPELAGPAAPFPAPAPVLGGAVRVRADLLDRLLGQAGEVMLTRTRLDTHMRGLRGSFSDLGSSLERLRAQLRDLEVQTESQMQSRRATEASAHPDFDPLEFDRYTRVQELTRMLAESVEDVATVQRNLQRAVESAEDSLSAQARQTRDLQRDLLRTRMVEFESLTERFHRVVRQAAQALGKEARLELSGGQIEVDRGVLDRMTPAFEHLLRNAVAHGIEAPALRQQRGKPTEGVVRVALSQAGNDLIVRVSDDGAGLDLVAIGERAVARGQRAAADGPPTFREAAELVFGSGFSTASEVSELAGRGIGLDAVRSDVRAVGGQIEAVQTEAVQPEAEEPEAGPSGATHAGGGLGWRLVLPLTTAVTQVVMLRIGDFRFGVPSNWVSQVLRVHAAPLAAAYGTRQWTDDSGPMPFFWGGAVLKLSPESADPEAEHARTWPVLVFRSAGQRVAWHVDEVLGHQEAVVKPLGVQLARLPGLSGATVLASGSVALIYNPVALSTVYGDEARAWVRSLRGGANATDALPLPAAPLSHQQAFEATRPVQAPLVLVVDDSITVRRVTQRLLLREGYRVALAADGMQALEVLRNERPVVVLCDIEMPRMDGFELVRHLRRDAQWADLPVVMITSRSAAKHQEHARSLGVQHYLGKPYPEEELLQLVASYANLPSAASLMASVTLGGSPGAGPSPLT